MALPNHIVHAVTDGAAKVTLTPEGGIAIALTNKTGSASVKGELVEASTGTDNAFEQMSADSNHPIGAVYEAGVADGSECWVVIYGRCQVLLEDGTAATRGYWVRTSENDAGRCDATNSGPAGGTIGALEAHMCEIGHCLESQGSGTDVLCYIMMHFN
jgi:hypothetical protein